MKQVAMNTVGVVLMILGVLSLINIKTVTPREIASIYSDLHGGAR